MAVLYKDEIQNTDCIYHYYNLDRKRFMELRELIFKIGLLIEQAPGTQKIFFVIPPRCIKRIDVELKGISKDNDGTGEPLRRNEAGPQINEKI